MWNSIIIKVFLISEDKRRLDLDFFSKLLAQILKDEEEKRKKRKRTSQVSKLPRRRPGGESDLFLPSFLLLFFPRSPLSQVCSECSCLSLQRGRRRSILQIRRRMRARAVTPWMERRRRRTCVVMVRAALLRKGREWKRHRGKVEKQTDQV